MILVTGGTGLVGSHLLLSLLEKEEKVRALFREEKSIRKTENLFTTYNKHYLFEKIEWIQGDVTDIPSLEKAFKNTTEVYHCAGLISFNPKDDDSLRKTNIEGTANIVNFCLHYNIAKLCHVSSIAALGHPKNSTDFVDEETEWNSELAYDHYAISKYGAEIEVWRGHQEGLNIVIVNPGIIIGPGFWNQGSGLLFSKIKQGLSFYTNGITGYTDIRDLTTIMTELMNRSFFGERYVVVNENASYKIIFQAIAQQLNPRLKLKLAPKWLLKIYFIGCFCLNFLGFEKYLFSKSMYLSANSQKKYTNTKIKNKLDYNFKSIQKTIAEFTQKRYF